MSKLLAQLDETGLTQEAKSFLRVELLTGCAQCSRRLISFDNAGAYMIDGTTLYTVQDKAGRDVAAYAVCKECCE